MAASNPTLPPLQAEGAIDTEASPDDVRRRVRAFGPPVTLGE